MRLKRKLRFMLEEERHIITMILTYYVWHPQSPLPEDRGICEECGRRVVVYECWGKEESHCLSNEAWKELIDRVIQEKKR